MSYLRICIRYGAERKEGCSIKVEGGGNGIVMSAAEHALFRGRIGKPQVAIRPHCGEVSVYTAEIDKLKKLLRCRAFAHAGSGLPRGLTKAGLPCLILSNRGCRAAFCIFQETKAPPMRCTKRSLVWKGV